MFESQMVMMSMKNYSELIALPTWEDRFEYAKLSGAVGKETFGSLRYLNQSFYQSREWKDFRRLAIIRDEGRDLAVEGFEIKSGLEIHHLNPITPEDILNENWDLILGLWNVVCVSHQTHKALHYGDASSVPHLPKKRTPNDTCPWKQ